MKTSISCLLVSAAVLLAGACSVKKTAIRSIGGALSGASDQFARDEDPELIKGALPFSLKVLETVLAEDPKNAGVLTSLNKGFTQYAYGFVLQEADELSDKDAVAAKVARDRAVKLFLRGKNYGMRALELKRPAFAQELKANPKQAVQAFAKPDVPLLYWTAVGWAAALATSRDFLMIGQIPQFEALMERALELDESYEQGAIHGFYIAYEMARLNGKGDKAANAKKHYDRAVELGQGKQAGPLVSYAENVLVPGKNRAEFESLLQQALKLDVNAAPDYRVLNLIFQKRARWLLSRTDRLFPNQLSQK